MRLRLSLPEEAVVALGELGLEGGAGWLAGTGGGAGKGGWLGDGAWEEER